MEQKLRVVIVGTHIGSHHIRAFKGLPDLFDVIDIFGLKVEQVRNAAKEINIPHLSTDNNDLYAMDNLDVIDLCTPSHLHTEQVLATLAANKHVICEKPVAGSLKEADDLIEAEATSGKRVMPIFQYRFGHGVQKLQFLIREGLAGQASSEP
mgnify:CR=1 FL=1